MTPLKQILVAGATALALQAQATTVALPASGSWYAFDVDVVSSGSTGWIDVAYNGDFSALSFSFTIAAGDVGTLTVVDAGYAGDRFAVDLNGATAVFITSAGVNNFPTNVGLDFGLALADGNYSFGVYTLGAGSYTLSGSLLQSALDGSGVAFDATVGGVSLSVSPVPEPATALSLLAGLGLLGLRLRRA